jgi:hypothetical protein
MSIWACLEHFNKPVPDIDDVSVYHHDARARMPLATPLPEGFEKMELVQPLRKLSLSQSDRSICKYNPM